MFEKAARLKLRFSHKGQLSVEDLWELPLTELDGIFKALNAARKIDSEESLLSVRTPETTTLELKISLVKHVVTTKLAERDARENVAAKKVHNAKILDMIARKQDTELEGKSIEDLQKELQ